MTFSLPKKHRIKRSLVFERILTQGKRSHTKNLTVIYIKNDLGYPRCGFMVSKKICKSAVKRNRIKRILRAIFRNNKKLFNSFDILFRVNKDISGLKYDEIFKEIKDAFPITKTV